VPIVFEMHRPALHTGSDLNAQRPWKQRLQVLRVLPRALTKPQSPVPGLPPQMHVPLRSNQEKDASEQAAILDHLLSEHPKLLRYSDLLRELAPEQSSPFLQGSAHLDKEALDRALRVLQQKGTIYAKGSAIVSRESDPDTWIVPTETALFVGRSLPLF
jgi:hypothetical protein